MGYGGASGRTVRRIIRIWVYSVSLSLELRPHTHASRLAWCRSIRWPGVAYLLMLWVLLVNPRPATLRRISWTGSHPSIAHIAMSGLSRLTSKMSGLAIRGERGLGHGS